MYSLGIDVGSSSVKVSILDIRKGKSIGSAFYPPQELEISVPQEGWAEQDPEIWWGSFLKAFQKALEISKVPPKDIHCIGISYQMHGLVILDKNQKVLRPSIIWCDSRAVEVGEQAFQKLGEAYCTSSLLNAPGNFTASKLRWVQENEPDLYEQIEHFLLPGDYIAYRLSGTINTTPSGLSEGIFWDFKNRSISDPLLKAYDLDKDLVPDLVPTFGKQSEVSKEVANLTGIPQGTPISYRAGDQPNNAFSLNVLDPGEVAATAGTSGVIYAVTEDPIGDKASRVNTFLHVSDRDDAPRNGILLCVNGTGILNSWLRRMIGGGSISYPEMNELAAEVPIGSDGVKFFPFGNGAERVLENKYPKATLSGIDYNRHQQKHLYRAGQEGIVFALRYGFDVLSELGVAGTTIRAGKANMFLSPVFREAFVNTVGARVELYETDGAEGAARGAAMGADLYTSREEAFAGFECLLAFDPEEKKQKAFEASYQEWVSALDKQLNH